MPKKPDTISLHVTMMNEFAIRIFLGVIGFSVLPLFLTAKECAGLPKVVEKSLLNLEKQYQITDLEGTRRVWFKNKTGLLIFGIKGTEKYQSIKMYLSRGDNVWSYYGLERDGNILWTGSIMLESVSLDELDPLKLLGDRVFGKCKQHKKTKKNCFETQFVRGGGTRQVISPSGNTRLSEPVESIRQFYCVEGHGQKITIIEQNKISTENIAISWLNQTAPVPMSPPVPGIPTNTITSFENGR